MQKNTKDITYILYEINLIRMHINLHPNKYNKKNRIQII